MDGMRERAVELLKLARSGIEDVSWHWFAHHFFHPFGHPLATAIIQACIHIDAAAPGEAGKPGIGTVLLGELASIGGREGHKPHYEQLMQKLGEILVIERVTGCPWPPGTTFRHEPAAFKGGPRPELLVVTPEERLIVEVKTPSLLAHARQRGENGVQLPYREGLPLEGARDALGAGGLTLPRDNPVLDFLKDADRKFRGFRADGQTAGLLVIVWDDHIYEPISTLVNPRSGLLTPNSFAKGEDGAALRFPDIDAVVVVRHLHNFARAAGDLRLLDRRHGLDFGDERALPNVLFGGDGGRLIPGGVLARLRAWPHDDPRLATMAEYNPKDVILWV